MFTILTVVNISQYICTANHHFVHYISILSQQIWRKKIIAKFEKQSDLQVPPKKYYGLCTFEQRYPYLHF